MEQVEDKPADGVDVRTFSEAFFGEQVHFYVLRLRKSFLVWAGYGASFQALAVAMSTRHVSEVEVGGGARTARRSLCTFYSPPSFSLLSLSSSSLQSGAPTSTQLLGDAMNDASCTLARRLSER